MYDGATTTVKSAAELTEEFKVGVGLHQDSALSPFLFTIITDKLTEGIRKDVPWEMLFADGIAVSGRNHKELDNDLEICTGEKKPVVSRSKTQYLKAGGVDDEQELKRQGEKVKRAKNFK